MQPGSSDHVNLRLDNAQWISTDADRVYFAKLVAEISGRERPGEKLNIAPIEEPFAWRRNYQLLEALRRRGHEKTAVETAAAHAMTVTAQSRLMGEFAADRQGLISFKNSNRQQWPTLAEYVGISDADLVEGPRDEHFGIESGWHDKAARIAGALQRLQGMTPTEKADARRVVEERRRVDVLRAHDADIVNIRDVLAHILQRLEALETAFPSQKEIREAADAA